MQERIERNKIVLAKYIPAPAIPVIINWIYTYDIKLKIKKSRDSIEGDYTPPHKGKNHVITVNKDLNPYAFLITLIHEVAHLVTWTKYKNSIAPHGKEWKEQYNELLNSVLTLPDPDQEIFPLEVRRALKAHLLKRSAASCSDAQLYRVLHQYDQNESVSLLEQLPRGAHFRLFSEKRSEVYVKEGKVRTRFQCKELKRGVPYLIPALCKVIRER